MPLSILTNIASQRAQRRIGEASEQLQTTYERLSSGQRINRASDDPAGRALVARLRNQARLASTAMRNANDGVSLISVTDSALGEIGNILVRMSELAAASANGVTSALQRSPLQNEFTALGSEIERIANTTRFNGLYALSSASNVVLQVGLNGQEAARIEITNITGTLQAIRLANTGSSALTYSLSGNSQLEAQVASRTALDAVMAAIAEVSSKRGILGAVESRLTKSINTLSQTRDELTAATDRISSADVAVETANLLRLQILQSASTAIVAQANQQSNVALRLLQQE